MKVAALVALFITISVQEAASQSSFSCVEKGFRALEGKGGVGLVSLGVHNLPVNLLYQQNIRNHLAAVVYSEVGIPTFFGNNQGIYEKKNYLHWLEGVGLGPTYGWQFFNLSAYGIVGGRYYHSKVEVESLHDPVLITNKLFPELGFLGQLKVGSKCLYFSAQLYVPFYPFQKTLENDITLSAGIGYRL